MTVGTMKLSTRNESVTFYARFVFGDNTSSTIPIVAFEEGYQISGAYVLIALIDPCVSKTNLYNATYCYLEMESSNKAELVKSKLAHNSSYLHVNKSYAFNVQDGYPFTKSGKELIKLTLYFNLSFPLLKENWQLCELNKNITTGFCRGDIALIRFYGKHGEFALQSMSTDAKQFIFCSRFELKKLQLLCSIKQFKNKTEWTTLGTWSTKIISHG